MSRLIVFLFIPSVVLCSVAASGCSLVGFGIGYAVDSATRDTAWVHGSEVLEVMELDSTKIRMADGTTLGGTSLMTVHLPKSMYEREYVDIVESRGLHLPRLYDSVEVVRLRGFAAQRTLVAPFLGFGVDTLARGGTMKVMAGSEVKSIPLTTIVTVTDRRGGEWEGKALLEQLGQLPLDRALLLKSQTGDTLLAVNDVDSLFAPRDPGWRWVGLGVGAVVDVAALVVLSVAMSDFDIDLSGLGRSR